MASPDKGAAATAYGQLFDMIESYSTNNKANNYYTFGWSGLLSSRMRYLEAKIFYDQILKEFDEDYKSNQNLKIRIIGYSHGGNIALKLAEVYKKEGYEKTKKIKIDELILIGVPVLPETDYLMNSSLFKKIYHFYSFGDRIQRLDFFSLDRIFSNRKFHERTDFAIPEKLIQINVKVKRAVLTKKKSSYTQKKISYLLHHRSSMRNSDPGHTELWSFGWTPTSYRQSFPLNPLPFTLFAPYIIEQLNQSMPEAKNLMIELHPHHEHMLFYDFDNKYEKIRPFLTREQFAQLQNHAELFRPDNYTKKKYNKKIDKAIKTARQEQFDQWKEQKILKRQKNQTSRKRFHNDKKSSIESC